MPETTVQPYDPSMAEAVARLIDQALAEHRDLPPMSYFATPAPDLGAEAMLPILTGEDLRADLSFVALEDGEPVAATIARADGEEVGWWRIATAPTHRRQGLAAACLTAGEEAARAAGVGSLTTLDTVDSRWESAGALLRGAGYELVDPSLRNISMSLDMAGWQEREIELPDGYELVTYTEEHLEAWTECRNLAFETDSPPSWFVESFVGRPTFDPSGWYMVMRGDRVVGISGALPSEVVGGMIEYVGVVPEGRGLHLGETVVVACLNWFSRRGVNPVVLITQPFRVPAVKLYEKLGFAAFAAAHKYMKVL